MALFAALQVLDFETTLLAFALGGYEMNPIMRQFVQLGPITGLVLGKAFAILLFAALARYRPAGIVKIQIFYGILVAWNVFVVSVS